MPSAFAFLLDAPTGEPKPRIQIAKLGDKFKDPRYGRFAITADQVTRWAANLARLPGGRAPIDLDHLADKPGGARRTEAAGWITNVSLEDGVPFADVEWTTLGEQAIKDKRYLFFSPTFGEWADEEGQSHKDTLLGGALTNRPFLNMPTVCLSQVDPFVIEDPNGDAADSQPVMPDLEKIATALGLDTAATEAQILEAVETAKAAKPEPKTLDAQAADAGKVLLDKDEHDRLKATEAAKSELDARVQTLEKNAADGAFDIAFTKALEDGRVDAKPETRTRYRKIYDLDADVAIDTLTNLPKIVNLDGSTVTERDQTAGAAPDGHDPESYELDQKVQAYLGEHPDLEYSTALDRVLATQKA